jgi:hypothetical protein
MAYYGHLQGQSTALLQPTNNLSGPPTTDRQSTALDEINMRLDSLINEFNAICQRMFEANTRSMGNEPSPSQVNPPATEPIGAVGLVVHKLNMLNETAEFQRQQITRLEKLL